MGVQGLWQLIEQAGKPVPVETLQNRILAVDVSIWLHQLVKGVNDGANRNANAPLLALFHRICKLLYFRIKPIFVFDGGVPALKKKTIAARQNSRMRAGKAGEKARMELLENLVKRQALGTVLDPEAQSTSVTTIPSIPSTSIADKRDNMFHLPPLPENNPAESVLMSDSDSSSDDENSRYSYFGDLHSIDVNSKDFLALPPDIRHSILTELKETRKQNSWAKIREMPENLGDFSSFQMERLLKRRNVQVGLEQAENEMGGVSFTLSEINSMMAEQGIAISQRIASDDTTRFLYASNSTRKTTTAKGKVNLSPVKEESEDNSLEVCKLTVDSFEESSNSMGFMDCSADSAVLSQWEILEIIKQQNRKAGGRDLFDIARPGTSKDCRDVVERREEMSELGDDRPHPCVDDVEATQCSTSAEDLQKGLQESLKAMEAMNQDENEENIVQSTSLSKELQEVMENKLDVNSVKLVSVGETILDERKTVRSPDSGHPICLEKQMSEERKENKDKNKIEDAVRPVSNSEIDSSRTILDEQETTESAWVSDLDSVGGSRTVDPEPEAVAEGNDDTSEEEDDFVEIPGEVSSPESENSLNSAKDSPPAGNNSDDGLLAVTGRAKSPEGKAPSGCLQIVVDTAAEMVDDEEDMFADIFSAPHIKPKSEEEESAEEWKPDTTRASAVSSYFDSPIADGRRPSDSKPLTIEPVKQLTAKEIIEMKERLERESRELLVEANREERLAATISDQMTAEAQELLQLFGIPYVVAPMEAEAQCAYLEATGQTDGTICDDSDIWLFGAANVYKNFFNQKKYVLQFKSTDIHRCYRVLREELVLVALLSGSDYTEGLKGVGPVTALEILARFPHHKADQSPVDRLMRFKRALHSGQLNNTPLAKKLNNVTLSEGFPSREVVRAYLFPVVNEDREKFSWATPDLARLRQYTRHKFGWHQERTDHTLLPVLDKTAQNKTQMTLHGYFDWSVESLTGGSGRKRSKRVERAVGLLGGGDAGGQSLHRGQQEEDLVVVKKRRTKKPLGEKTSKAVGALEDNKKLKEDAEEEVPPRSQSPTRSHQKSRQIAARQAAREKAARVLAKLRMDENNSKGSPNKKKN